MTNETNQPEPLNVPTPENILAAAERIEFLIEYVRRTRRGHNAADQRWVRANREQFQNTNWDTIVRSMRAWADAMDPCDWAHSDICEKPHVHRQPTGRPYGT